MAEELKEIIRVSNTDLDGKKPLYHALRKIKGISFIFSNAICASCKIDRNKKAGNLTNEEVNRIENLLKSPDTKLPLWLLNRRKDYDTGTDKHLISSDLKLTQEFDIKRLQKIRSRRGLRHAWGLPLRGQRTRHNFRKGTALGVKKRALQPQAGDKGEKKK
ncbi:MAG: 30S ribosomal protein S13 [Candidatus Woesearchaeota archaeon]|nr:MAG: 30S ribosomal protein S13 [Candidatus Woesearchaeota archaeon]